MFDIATRAVSATRAVVATLCSHILASLLHRTLNAELLHILVCRYFRINMMSLENQSQGHCYDKEGYGPYCHTDYHQYIAHKITLIPAKIHFFAINSNISGFKFRELRGFSYFCAL